MILTASIPANLSVDTLVTALNTLDDVEVTVVAPLTQQSGQGGKTTEGELEVTDVELASGYPAKAVDGFPADAINVAFDELGAETCESGYVVGNHASAAVSRKVGYVESGRRRRVQQTRDGKVGSDEQRVVVTPATFVRPDEPVTVTGAEALRRFLGIDRTS